MRVTESLLVFLLACRAAHLSAEVNDVDWCQFLGSDDRAARSDRPLPITWSESDGVRWKLSLPGPGSSSPIVLGSRVLVTCYSGYGVDDDSTDAASLTRHLLCVDRSSGEVLWSRTTPALQPEDTYYGYITDHGYASNTPVTDGERVYVFYGKTGVLAFDLEGNQLWQANVGTGSSKPKWGSAASLTLAGELLIVTASEESQSIRALHTKTGAEVWKYESEALELCYGTPRLVTSLDGRQELVLAVLGEAWGLDAKSGELNWFAQTKLTDNINPSPVMGDGVVYLFGGFRSSGSHAIRLGGTGDVTNSHLVWSSRSSSYVATPLLHAGHLYWIDYHGLAFCISAKTGEEVYRERVPGFRSRRPVYASPVLAGDKIYVVSRKQGVYVLDAQPQFNVVAINKLAADTSDFNATPAISQRELFIRSNKFLYCVGD